MANILWRIGIRDSKNRIWIDFPSSEYNKILLQSRVQGLRYDRSAKFYDAPLDLDTAREIRDVARAAGGKFVMTDDLKQWAVDEKKRQAAIIRPDDQSQDISKMLPALRKNRPKLVEAMEAKPWQIIGTSFIVGQKSVLLADQPGLGKTIQTLAAITELDVRGPILVVAPRTAINVTWPDEINQWLGIDGTDSEEIIVKINAELLPKERSELIKVVHEFSQSPNLRIWVLCGPNYLRIKADLDDKGNYVKDERGKKIIRTLNEGVAELFGITWSAVIVDESHQTLAGSTGNKKKQSSQRLGLGALPIRQDGLQIAISGTPFRGKTENIWGTLNWLLPKKYTAYWKWINKHYTIIATGSKFGSGIGKGDKLINPKAFFKELEPVMIRRTKKEVAKDLPPKTYGGTRLDPTDEKSPVAVWLPLSKKQKTQYDEIIREATITFDEMSDSINVNGALAELTRLQQVSLSCLTGGVDKPQHMMPSNKVDWIIQFLIERISAGTKTIVASQYTGFLEMLSGQLFLADIKHYVFTGKTKDAERAKIKKMFQHPDGEMVILLNTKAGGVSLTLDMADDVVVCDQTWVPDDQEQVEDRAHRASRNHNVTIWVLASKDTIDEDLAIINAEREDEIIEVLDRQRGVKYKKKIIDATIRRIST